MQSQDSARFGIRARIGIAAWPGWIELFRKLNTPLLATAEFCTVRALAGPVPSLDEGGGNVTVELN